MYNVCHLEQNERYREHVSLDLLACIYPRALVEQCVHHSPKRQQKRRRKRHFIGADAFWLLLGMALWNRLAQARVWDRLTRHRQVEPDGRLREPAGASAVSYQREALGSEPLQAVFTQCCRPLCTPATPGAFFQGRRLLALDGTRFNVADTPANDTAFGRSQNQYGKGAYPQVQVQMLMECGSHAVTALTMGRMERGEIHGAMELLPSIASGSVLLHDSCFVTGAFWEALSHKGVLVLSALASTVVLTRQRNLPDGSYLAQLTPCRSSVYPMHRPLWVRVIEYQLTDARLGEPGHVYRLITTWLNPRRAPASQLIVLYHERWEIEGMLDEVKTHQREQKRVLRSRTPDGVRQEVWALFLLHYAIRALMYQAALQVDLDPDRLRFTEALFQVTQAAGERGDGSSESGDPPPHLLSRLRRRLLAPRRLCVHPRQVKQINKRFPAKKRGIAPAAPFAPDEQFADFVVLLFRPTGSRDLGDAFPLYP